MAWSPKDPPDTQLPERPTGTHTVINKETLVPRSPMRRRKPFTPPPEKVNTARLSSPPWLVPLMIASFIAGLLWIVVYYVSQTEYPVKDLGQWNMAVGFGMIIFGFLLSTRWR